MLTNNVTRHKVNINNLIYREWKLICIIVESVENIKLLHIFFTLYMVT